MRCGAISPVIAKMTIRQKIIFIDQQHSSSRTAKNELTVFKPKLT
jgi:hypothetical protein